MELREIWHENLKCRKGKGIGIMHEEKDNLLRPKIASLIYSELDPGSNAQLYINALASF